MVSLGGNALGKTPEEQKELLKTVAKPIVDLIKQGHQVVIANNGREALAERTDRPTNPRAVPGRVARELCAPEGTGR